MQLQTATCYLEATVPPILRR